MKDSKYNKMFFIVTSPAAEDVSSDVPQDSGDEDRPVPGRNHYYDCMYYDYLNIWNNNCKNYCKN